MAANELEEILTWFIGYPRQDDVTGNFDDTIKKLESLIESEKVKAVEEYKSAQRRDIPISRGISGKKLTGIVFDESSHIDSGHLEELESKEEAK